ncbi:MAG TPA: efflux transporter outer membrane subunit [Steroidobacteraceae bacterium]|jgi:NodT family efflux transporter outer membrane factor (OMF) lipoprotein
MNKAAGLVLTAAALLPGGCALGPDFHAPPPPQALGYLRPTPPSAEKPAPDAVVQSVHPGTDLPAQWWQLFASAALDAAVKSAIAHNPTIESATATLAQAREQVVVARAALLPRVTGSAGVEHSAGTATSLQQGATNLYSLGASASYALDIFGAARRALEQQQAQAELQRYQLAAAYLALTGNVVSEALTIASTRLQISTTQDLINSDRKNLALTQHEFEEGTAARSDVLTADSQLAADLTQLPSLQQQLEAARDAMNILLGRSPEVPDLHDFDISELTVPKSLPLSLPSELVRQRPDILSAEAQLHAASAAVGVAVAQEFPSLTLSASLTREALTAGNLFHQFGTAWDVGSGLTAPIFEGGALRAQARGARDAFMAQQAAYRGVVLEGLGQVADDLWALQHDAERLSVYTHSLQIAADSLKLQQTSYAVGRSNVLALIDAERTYAQARLGYATAQIEQLQDTAGLFVALGGSWWQDGVAQGTP